jgi:uncharacterized protein YndB with AHSA1/START domain
MPATPAGTSALEHEVRIAARPETVFSYFTDPGRIVRWMGSDATLDPRPGGVFRLVFRPNLEVFEYLASTEGVSEEVAPRYTENAVLGEFVEVEPPNRIVFTWGYERELFAMPPQASSVEVSLTPDGDDTVVRLVHRRLPENSITFHRGGWDHYLPRLAIAAAGGDPGPDPMEAAADAGS